MNIEFLTPAGPKTAAIYPMGSVHVNPETVVATFDTLDRPAIRDWLEIAHETHHGFNFAPMSYWVAETECGYLLVTSEMSRYAIGYLAAVYQTRKAMGQHRLTPAERIAFFTKTEAGDSAELALLDIVRNPISSDDWVDPVEAAFELVESKLSKSVATAVRLLRRADAMPDGGSQRDVLLNAAAVVVGEYADACEAAGVSADDAVKLVVDRVDTLN